MSAHDGSSDLGGSAPTRRWTLVRNAAPGLVLVGVLVAFFWRPLFGDGFFYFRDALRIYLPFRLFMATEFAAGRFPLWFPFEAGGVPFLAQIVPGLLHPLNLLYVALPFITAYQLNFVLAFLLASFGSYLWARGREISRTGALLSGLLYAYCGAIASQSNLHYLLGNASVPLALAALDRAQARPTAWRVLLASGALGLIFLAGEPQSLIMAGFFGLADALAAKGWSGRRRSIVVLAVASIGCGALTAIQLLPAAETFLSSARFGAIDREYWSFPAMRALELVIPDLLLESTNHVLPYAYASAYPWAPHIYIGPAAMALALAGVFTRDRRAIAVAVTGAAAFWMALGPQYGLEALVARVVPFWSGFRYPEKMIAFASLAVALLAGHGLDAIVRGSQRWLLPFTAALLAIVATTFWLLPGRELPGMAPFLEHGLTQALLALGIVVGLVLVAFVPWPGGSALRMRTFGAFALAAVPLLWFNHDAPKYEPASEFLVKPWTAEQLEQAAPDQPFPIRIFSAYRSQDRVKLPDGLSWIDASHHIARRALVSDISAVFGIENFQHYQPGVDLAYVLAIRGSSDQILYSRILPAFAVDYLVLVDAEVPVPSRWRLLKEEPGSGLRILEPVQRHERVYIARSTAHLADEKEAVRRLANPAFPLGDVALVDCEIDDSDTQVLDRGTARIVGWAPDEVAVAASMQEPGFLILNDTHAPGWHVLVDGEPAELCRANGFVRAVKLPPGEHQVVFYYAPASFSLGVAISMTVLAGWLVVAAISGLRNRRARGAV